jgi:rubrerythrin
MDLGDFNSVIDYAIGKEKQAIQFYRELQEIAQFTSRANFLNDLEDMERKHITILEEIRGQGPENLEIPEVPDMHLSETLTTFDPVQGMDYQDILLVGMKKEADAHKLYSDLADASVDESIKTTFTRLAAEELQHKNYFEQIYDEEILTEN